MPDFIGIVSQPPVVQIRLTPIYPGAQHIFGYGVVDTGAEVTFIDTLAATTWNFRQLGYHRMHSATEKNIRTPIFDARVELMANRGSYSVDLHPFGFNGGGAPVALHDMSKVIALIGQDILNLGVLVYDGPANNFLLRLP